MSMPTNVHALDSLGCEVSTQTEVAEVLGAFGCVEVEEKAAGGLAAAGCTAAKDVEATCAKEGEGRLATATFWSDTAGEEAWEAVGGRTATN